LGISLTALTAHDTKVIAGFSDGTSSAYDLVVGADGIYSTTLGQISV
jgi:2-polyprenyl-6-methoxyphenol hydroxylase-like FAD-dependent oxidoreductase